MAHNRENNMKFSYETNIRLKQTKDENTRKE